MLGIRHFGNKAIDLWQGPPAAFVSEGLYCCQAGDHPDSQPLACMPKALAQQASSGARHLCLVPGQPDALAEPSPALWASLAQAHMTALRQGLEAGVLGTAPKRITFLLPTSAAYDAFQEALFATFAEFSE